MTQVPDPNRMMSMPRGAPRSVRVPGGSVETSTGEVSTAAKTVVYPTLKVHVGWAF